jgi:outer membrane receptor for ferrienterochelin and colicin
MKNLTFIIGLLFSFVLQGQTISGKVSNKNNEVLTGASVYWLGTTIGTITNEKGVFEISSQNIQNKSLVASFVGYTSDTILIRNQSQVTFHLKEIKNLNEIEITEQKDGVVISNLNPIKTEIITQTELQKAACCDLAGCFETQTTVQPQVTNVITNAKELRILGLSGIYNQILIDGLPMIQGLTFTYGISGIPGTLVDNIYVSKGANSVLQGFESISGQINVETKEPDKTEKFLLNGYINSFNEKHFNSNFSFKKGKWSSLSAVHTVQAADKIDRDRDNFLDLPLLTRYMLFNKLTYGKEKDWGWSSSISMRYLNEQRVGGQTTFNSATDAGSASRYGQKVNISQPEISTKTSYRFNDIHRVTLLASSFYQEQQSYFGTVAYKAQQTNVYANLQYELSYAKKHTLKTGFSYRYLMLDEQIGFTENSLQRTFAGNYNRLEIIPGAFAENTMSFFNNKLTWIAGVRGDSHNDFGFTLTPRTLVKLDVAKNTTIRANFGTGWRTTNLFSENIGLLVSSRDIVFAAPLKPERAVNMGINLLHKFETNDISGYFSTDFYRTNFQNQIFPDYDTSPTKAIIDNFTGTSISSGFQAELSLKFYKTFEFKTGYNFLDVYRIQNGIKQLLPFNAAHKVLTTLSYKPLNNKFHIDANIHWYGQQRLPSTKSNPVEFKRDDFSNPFTLINLQFTYSFKKFDVYTGCENIFDFRQLQPIVNWQNPFSQYFDTSFVWGPTRGRELYVGFRFKLAH